jgi:hypothetical protein
VNFSFSFFSSTCVMGPYIYLVGFVWQRSAAHSSPSLAEPCVIDRRQSDRGCVGRYAATHRLPPLQSRNTPTTPVAARFRSEFRSVVLCVRLVRRHTHRIATEFPQKRQLHAHPRQLYFKLLSPSCSHCLILASTSASCPSGSIGAIVGRICG